MLDVALKFITDELNAYLLTRSGSVDKVKLSPIVDYAGKYAVEEDTLAVSIINIEEERTLKEHLPEYTLINGEHVKLEPPLKLNLHVLFAAYFKHYDEALKYISYVLTFFQSHSHFSADTYPALDSRIAKLVIELQSPNYEQLNQIWAFIGGKQLPSVLYKVRLVVVQDTVQNAVQPPLIIINSNLHGL